MKTVINFKKYAIIIVCVLLITSCEKSEVDSEITSMENQEGFKSSTGNNDSIVEDDNAKISLPVLRMHFDDNVSQEDAFAAFDKKVTEYIGAHQSQAKGVSTEWFYKIWTYTGTQTDNNTDGTVHASVDFNTDKGGSHTAYVNLDNVGNDREGGWDAYLFRTYISGKAISWVEAEHAHIRLKGTDGWFIKHFYIYVVPSNQSISASGSSYIFSHPDVWLDNTTSSGWDYYHTGNIGTGRLNF